MASGLDSALMSIFARTYVVLGALIALLTPSLAWACPYCAVRGDAGNAGTMLLGAMIALPFLIVATVVPTLRRAAAEGHELLPTDTE